MTNDEIDAGLKKDQKHILDMIRMGKGADTAAVVASLLSIGEMLAEIAMRLPEGKG